MVPWRREESPNQKVKVKVSQSQSNSRWERAFDEREKFHPEGERQDFSWGKCWKAKVLILFRRLSTNHLIKISHNDISLSREFRRGNQEHLEEIEAKIKVKPFLGNEVRVKEEERRIRCLQLFSVKSQKFPSVLFTNERWGWKVAFVIPRDSQWWWSYSRMNCSLDFPHRCSCNHLWYSLCLSSHEVASSSRVPEGIFFFSYTWETCLCVRVYERLSVSEIIDKSNNTNRKNDFFSSLISWIFCHVLYFCNKSSEGSYFVRIDENRASTEIRLLRIRCWRKVTF
jgi:hypothetical protein